MKCGSEREGDLFFFFFLLFWGHNSSAQELSLADLSLRSPQVWLSVNLGPSPCKVSSKYWSSGTSFFIWIVPKHKIPVRAGPALCANGFTDNLSIPLSPNPVLLPFQNEKTEAWTGGGWEWFRV